MAALAALAVLASRPAAAGPDEPGVNYVDPGSTGQVRGVGVESQDIAAISDTMVKDLLADPTIVGRPKAPRIIVDPEYFHNESTQRLNKNLLTDKLRITLQRASRGRLVFVSRESAAMVAQERQLKRDGETDVGTTGLAKAQLGADYRMIGRITTLDSRSGKTGTVERYTQVSFELVDLETGESVWSNQYEMKKAGTDDAIYR